MSTWKEVVAKGMKGADLNSKEDLFMDYLRKNQGPVDNFEKLMELEHEEVKQMFDKNYHPDRYKNIKNEPLQWELERDSRPAKPEDAKSRIPASKGK